MPILEEELRADDTAAELAGLLVAAAAAGLAEEELAEVPLEPLVVGELVVAEVAVVASVLPAVAAMESALMVAALATELACTVAELASARACATEDVSPQLGSDLGTLLVLTCCTWNGILCRNARI